jgi:Tol biopolymer transport system component/DNA-binding CsgD family transcriptional regulator
MEFPVQFSEREKAVIDLLLQGKSNKQMALSLGITNRTVEFHLGNIFTKLGVRSRSEAILMITSYNHNSSNGSVVDDLRESTVVLSPAPNDNVEKLNSPRRLHMPKKIWLIIILIVLLPICILFFWNVGDFKKGANSAELSSTTSEVLSPETNSSQLAFVSFLDGDLALYTIHTDGTQLTRLTQEKMLVMNPVWSPDGSRIAFEACLGGSMSTDCPAGVSFDIFVVNVDGSDLKNITNDPSSDRFPSWSPDGKIAFASDRTGNYEIYVINSDGDGLTMLTNSPTINTEPKWSANGEWIAYHCMQGSETQICVQPAEGASQTVKISGTIPVWSPLKEAAVQTLAFLCWSNGHSDICTVNPDGSEQVNLTNSSADETYPSWSPDGRWITYQSNQDDAISIYMLCADCSSAPKMSRLTSGEVNTNQPVWSREGTQIAYLSDGDLYVMNTDGSDQKQLASNVLGSPIWRP